MKNILIFVFLTSILFTSCKKEEITPGNYQAGQVPPHDTSHWQNQYGNGGTVPTGTGTDTVNNELVGTTWVLTKVVINYASTVKHDTIHFITNTKYYVGSDTNLTALYTLYTSQNNVTLTFKPFIPMNYMQCSTNQLGVGFASGKYITGIEFVNQYNTVSNFKAWFTKI